jgi:hypothetical protein
MAVKGDPRGPQSVLRHAEPLAPRAASLLYTAARRRSLQGHRGARRAQAGAHAESSTQQRILEAASLAGAQFAAGSVAHALELPADEIDSVCEGLAKVLDAAETDTTRVINAPVVGFAGGHMVVLAWLSGAPDEAIALADQMLARAELLRDPFHLSRRSRSRPSPIWRGELEKTFETARRALHVARDVGSLVWQGRAMSLYHWAATLLEPQTASAHFEELSSGLSGPLRAGPYGRTAFTPCVVEVYARAGHADAALQELDDALAFVEVTDERAWSSELHRLRGALLKDTAPAEAERAIVQGLEIARRQGARSFELRCALSLATLRRGSKRRAALEQLRRVFASFTDGLGTADLREAKALLAASP